MASNDPLLIADTLADNTMENSKVESNIPELERSKGDLVNLQFCYG